MSEPSSYTGKVKILDLNGVMFDVGKADLAVTDTDTRSWGGSIRLFDNSALSTKSLTSLLELDGGRQIRAQVGPRSGDGGKDMMFVKVVGIEDLTGF